MDFLHYKCSEYWDYPKGGDVQTVLAKYVFLGPVVPSETVKQGLFFKEDIIALRLYKAIKTGTHEFSISLCDLLHSSSLS